MKNVMMCVLAISMSAAILAETPLEPELELSVGSSDSTHSIDDPLLITITLSNHVASAFEARGRADRRAFELLRRSPAFLDLDEADRRRVADRYAPREIPIIELGSSAHPLSTAIRFSAEREGRKIDPTIRLLRASSAHEPTVKLDGHRWAHFFFGIDAAHLRALGPGSYSLRAVFDTRDQAEGWRGRIETEAIEIVLVSSATESLESRLSNRAIFHRLDHRFDEVEGLGRRLLELNARSIDGFVHLGDGLDGQGSPQEALRAFRAAYELYLENSEPGDEPPHYIDRRIEEVEARLSGR